MSPTGPHTPISEIAIFEVGTEYDVPGRRSFIDALTESAQCPVCWELPVGPIYLCLGGHIICSYCRSRLLKCPICAKGFTKVRNFSLEAVVANFEIQCRNIRCEVKDRSEELRAHMEICDFRDITCSEDHTFHCFGSKHSFDAYVSHLLRNHEYLVTKLEDSMSLVSAELALNKSAVWRWTQCILVKDGVTFFIRAKKLGTGVGLWIRALLSEPEAARFKAVVQRGEDSSAGAPDLTGTLHTRRLRIRSINSLFQPTSEDFFHIPIDGCKDAGRSVKDANWPIKLFIEEDVRAEVADSVAGQMAEPPNWALEIKVEKPNFTYIQAKLRSSRPLTFNFAENDVEASVWGSTEGGLIHRPECNPFVRSWQVTGLSCCVKVVLALIWLIGMTILFTLMTWKH